MPVYLHEISVKSEDDVLSELKICSLCKEVLKLKLDKINTVEEHTLDYCLEKIFDKLCYD